MTVPMHSGEEHTLLLEVWRRLSQETSSEERRHIAGALVSLLRSSSVAIRRSARYVLLSSFKLPRLITPERAEVGGPPTEKETRAWEALYPS